VSAVTWFSTLTILIFLVAAIVSLYFITNPIARLGTLVGFIVGFASVSALGSNGRGLDIFIATAA
jgi:hypothetical protein